VELVLVCDLFAWRRGHPHPGEPSHIVGGGPIPPDVARELAKDAFIKVVLHDGDNIHTVKHFGRHLTATLRTALDLGPVPQFTGRKCVDCGSRWGLEYDHVNPVANQGATPNTPTCRPAATRTTRSKPSGTARPDYSDPGPYSNEIPLD
jgi:hypothetical protein